MALIKKFFFIMLLGTISVIINGCSDKVTEKPHFIQYNASFYAEKDSEYPLSISYLNTRNSKSVIKPENVTSIQFGKDKLVKIKNYKFYESNPSKKYSISNIELNLSFPEIGKEEVHELTINFIKGNPITFPIGNWIFNIEPESSNKEFLEMGKDYGVVFPKFDGYRLNFYNKSNEKISISDVKIQLKSVKFEKSNYTINPKTTLTTINKIKGKPASDMFFIIRPKIEYKLNDQNYSYYPYASLYGNIEITDEDLEREFNKTS
ncbi:hypothetical protein [Paenibacillus humicus]|uniref:hypothetical protein n=1 Tax=Paenibacillus humicus TaxID=412861 RepID=UPI003F150107